MAGSCLKLRSIRSQLSFACVPCETARLAKWWRVLLSLSCHAQSPNFGDDASEVDIKVTCLSQQLWGHAALWVSSKYNQTQPKPTKPNQNQPNLLTLRQLAIATLSPLPFLTPSPRFWSHHAPLVTSSWPQVRQKQLHQLPCSASRGCDL